MYAQDNAGNLLETGDTSGANRAPALIFIHAQPHPQYLNLEAVIPYLPGLKVDVNNANDIYVGGIWWCPSSGWG